MDKILALYDEIGAMGVNFYLWDIEDSPSAAIEINGKRGIFMDFDKIASTAEEAVLLAHEGGHIAIGSTHHLDSPYDIIEQHENRADKWAIEKIVPRDELDRAVRDGHTEIWDLAEYFNVTEPFMRKAAWWYQHGNLAVETY